MKNAIMGVVAGLTLMTIAPAIAADAEAVYNANCGACHTVLPPKLGDKAAWEPLKAQGIDALVASIIKGKGVMLPRAGKPDLSDADIKLATEYMDSKSQ